MKYIFSCKIVALLFIALHCLIRADVNVEKSENIQASESKVADDGNFDEDDRKLGDDGKLEENEKLGDDGKLEENQKLVEDDENIGANDDAVEDQQNSEDEDYNFYSFTVQDAEGKDVNLNKYLDKVSLVVNVASECGYTDNHYKGLNKIHNHLSPTGKFTVLAFPCNQFGRQEPGTNKEILNFVHSQYKAKFPVFGKINVIDNDVPAAWKYLIDESGTTPSWNFFKYLVDVNGKVLNSWGPWTSINEIYKIIQQEVTNAMKTRHTEL